ncbi:amino acid/amide ABC transporter substrate-binding protein, HAAT family [Desulfotomaculum arcticum]|uniref:Amino acid/amide ABC transporter substrate-binding protein, HAAT family n=1 Tax=Desulfotruncus arcticus DSM 17038 TaxID=1121424 RepID=A0A1I2PHL6_9FIRM|nr:ABC transporter substrate-binding protein [Desulfotruncus arcticus]SFG13126.1 amino acid/amide ABC transporter substrate-binding protein, HAAT family [Desulfotomaculum arcticum] [Desulfotruncus arcticus DSM 17038]
MSKGHWIKILISILVTSVLFFVMFGLFMSFSNRKGQVDIVIGVAWPFSVEDDLFKEGVELAAEQINARGGVNGHKVRLIEKDDQETITGGMNVAQSFTKVPNLTAVIGHSVSFISTATSRIYENAGIVMLSPSSTAPALTKKGYKYIFRNIPSDDEIARQLALYAARQGQRRMVIYYADDSYGIGLANSFEDYARKNGIEIVDRFSYYADTRDLDRISAKWKALDYDGIFVAHFMPDGAQFIADAAKTGVNVPFFAGDAMDTPQLYQVAGKAAEGTVVGTIFNPRDTRPEVKSFIKDFYSKYGKMPTPYAAQGYDAVNLLVEAVKEADSASPSAVAQKLRTFKNVPGVAGSHTFTDNGDDIGDLVVKKMIKNGQFEYIH